MNVEVRHAIDLIKIKRKSEAIPYFEIRYSMFDIRYFYYSLRLFGYPRQRVRYQRSADPFRQPAQCLSQVVHFAVNRLPVGRPICRTGRHELLKLIVDFLDNRMQTSNRGKDALFFSIGQVVHNSNNIINLRLPSRKLLFEVIAVRFYIHLMPPISGYWSILRFRCQVSALALLPSRH